MLSDVWWWVLITWNRLESCWCFRMLSRQATLCWELRTQIGNAFKAASSAIWCLQFMNLSNQQQISNKSANHHHTTVHPKGTCQEIVQWKFEAQVDSSPISADRSGALMVKYPLALIAMVRFSSLHSCLTQLKRKQEWPERSHGV